MSAATVALTLVAQTARMAVPYACAGLGGIWSERSGVVNIALEGILLSGAFGAVVIVLATGSPWLGLIAGAAVGAAVALIHARVVVVGGVDAIVSGIALNLVAAGGTRFALRALYASSSNSPAIVAFPEILQGAGGARALLRTLVDPLVILTVVLALVTSWAMAQTRFGLHVRASGEDPQSARSAGVAVERVRQVAVALGGAMAGVGGVALAYDEHRFDSALSGGRGFIALAAVILSGWRTGWMVAACLAFAALDALQIIVQEEASLAGTAVQALPYMATLVVLWVTARGRSQAPAGLGRP